MIRRGIFSVALLGASLLLAIPAAGLGQDNSAPPAQKPPAGSAHQKKDQKKPSEAEQNPFPEAKSAAAAQKAKQDEQQGEQNAASPAPAPQDTQSGKPSTADRNPFPEAESEKAAQQDQQQNGASQGDNGDFSSSQVKGLDAPDTESGAKSEPPPAPGHNPGLAKTDTKVGLFYLDSGDYKGAYDRFLEATQSDPGNAEAVYGLGESAWRLNKRDEAIRNFRLYLSALPDGPRAKEIRRTMKKMGVEPPA